ncbi:hypothetical protein [Zooshikella harenae]|uniref:5'-3' exonuclease alpha-helical arch N-terminal domain-containing protein n=1 Tax=Zooshikella harenae TaxID=2827238 RepID=A0ABS5ZK18_9GAMM|nr:hypothetical protein [Zooshikella harenae]MBU2714238.1 hypothetical protein [Zooshikella harenae]
MSTNRVGLLDTDILCFQAASAAQRSINWGNDWWTFHADFNVVREIFEEKVRYIKEACQLDKVIMCLTDRDNLRKTIYPQYKGNRKGIPKPCSYPAIVEYAINNYTSFKRPSLEADDVMGILATWSKFYSNYKKIIVSEDKDMQTIGNTYLFNPVKDLEPRFISKSEADRFFMKQILTGDTADGYPGCPNVVDSLAEELLTDRLKFESYEHTFKSGPRKGTSEIRWEKVPSSSMWETVVSCYEKNGLSEDVAIQQARCARILRACDYDFKLKRVILWKSS